MSTVPTTQDTQTSRGPISWMARNHVTANLLMLVFLLGGGFSITRITQEVFPEFTFDAVSVSVSYPGASPEDVEQGILLAIEEAVRGTDGVIEITSVASEGYGSVSIEYDPTATDDQQFYQDIKQEIDRIRTFPDDAEEPRVSLASRRRDVIEITLYGDVSEYTLRNIAENVRETLLSDPRVTLAELSGDRDPEVHIQPRIEDLRRYGMTFSDISRIVANSSVEVPGGSVKTDGGEILVRFDERKDYAYEFDNIPIITTENGSVVRLRDIADVDEGFEDVDRVSTFDGHRCMGVEVFRIGDQTPTEVSRTVRMLMEEIGSTLPEGVDYAVLNDRSDIFEQRLNLLSKNLVIGLLLVLLLLGIFLDIRLAFWVTMGIPISFLGALLFFPEMGVSINMITMFAFIIALGIVVDDAIVVGENIYEYRQNGMKPMQAAVRGAREVALPVTFSILTNIVAFIPLMMVPGFIGKIWKMIPLVVGTVFIISLVESLFILPAHLAHLKESPDRGIMHHIHRFQQVISHLVRDLIYKIYAPFLDNCIRLRYIVVALSFAILLICLGYVGSGRLGMTLMPRVESDYAYTSITMPLGTPMSKMLEVRELLESKAKQIVKQNGGDQLSEGIYSSVRENTVQSRIFLTDPEIRPKSTKEITMMWRGMVGEVAGAERSRFDASRGGPGGGDSLSIELSHTDINVLEKAGAELADMLREYPITKNVDDGYNPGKLQFEFTLKEEGRSLGLTSQNVASQIRSAFYGSRALRQQRGRNEVDVLVRLPEDYSNSLHDLEELMILTPAGQFVPLKTIAEPELDRAYRSINRRDGRRTLMVSANVEPENETSRLITTLKENELPQLLRDFHGLSYSFEGRQADMRDSLTALRNGFLISVVIIFALLAIPFNSYFQPIIVMTAIPFGLVGAILGHLIMGYSLSVISMMGIIALCGVVINDSLVMIVFANAQRKEGKSSFDAIHNAGVRRFRPILLTTMTTFGGLAPMIFETSRQARFMIPMAISLGYGLLFATAITLVLVPSLYMILEDIRGMLGLKKR